MRILCRLSILAPLLFLVVESAVAAGSVEACLSWVRGLPPELQSRVSRDSSESPHWHFLPLNDSRHPSRDGTGYRGVHFSELSPVQITQLELLMSQISQSHLGQELHGVREMDQILFDESIPPSQDPRFLRENYGDRSYMVAVYGMPDASEGWALRVQGHHFSSTINLKGDDVVGVGPLFLGAWPRSIYGKRHSDLLVPEQADRIVTDLMGNLGAGHREPISPKIERPVRNLFGPGDDVKLVTPAGLDVSQLTKPEQTRIIELIRLYVDLLPPSLREKYVATARENIQSRGSIFLRVNGDEGVGAPKSFLLQVLPNHEDGFIIEWVAVDQTGDHVHSLWRPNR